MTRALRTRHRRALYALAVLLPAAVAIALAARPTWPRPAALGIGGLDDPAGHPLPADDRIPGRGAVR